MLFDLPGTVGNPGVLSAITSFDYIFVPMKADRLVLESTLNFATTINDRFIKTGTSQLKGIYLFWNMVDRRERNALYGIYEKGINQLGLSCLQSRIPLRSNFNKDLTSTGGPVYRSTLLAPDNGFILESGFVTLMDEILSILNID